MNGLTQLDRILRGDPPADDAPPRLRPLLMVMVLLAVGYGLCMGSFGILGRAEPEWRQLLASAVKVPLLFTLSAAVTFPSLYVFNTLLGTKQPLGDLVVVSVKGLAVLIAVLAALGPIVAFFSATTVNYPFILLLNFAVFVVSGVFGISHLLKFLAQSRQGTDQVPELGRVFRVWLVAAALVTAQMAWVLRPFVGSPFLPFTWFRPREASVFEALLKAVRQLLWGSL